MLWVSLGYFFPLNDAVSIRSNPYPGLGYQVLPPNLKTFTLEEKTFNMGALEVAVNPELSVKLVVLGIDVEY